VTESDRAIITELRQLNSLARKGPWYPQGARSKGKAVYRIGEPEERLIIAMRNNIERLLDLASRNG
jgi:hypothetical protein